MPAALLFYRAISPTYTQSFNYRSKESAATNFSFRALLVPCSVQSVRAQLSRKWLIPPSGRVSTWLMLFFFLSLLYFLFPAVIYSGSGMIQLTSTVSITQNGENPELSFERYIRKNKKNVNNRDLGRLPSVTNGNKMALWYKKYRKNSKIGILLQDFIPCLLQGRLHPC